MDNLFVISYLVVGFEDKTKYATLNKEYKTEKRARNFINKAMGSKKYELMMLRKEEKYIGNNENLEIAISTPIETFTQ